MQQGDIVWCDLQSWLVPVLAAIAGALTGSVLASFRIRRSVPRLQIVFPLYGGHSLHSVAKRFAGKVSRPFSVRSTAYELVALEGTFDKTVCLSTGLLHPRSGGERGRYFYFLVANTGSKPAKGCFPLVYIITSEEKRRAPALWLKPTRPGRIGEVDEFADDIPPKSKLPAVFLATQGKTLFYYDMDELRWVALSSSEDIRFTLIATVHSANASLPTSHVFEGKFQASDGKLKISNIKTLSTADSLDEAVALL